MRTKKVDNSEFGVIEKKDAVYFSILAISSGVLFSFNAFHVLLQVIIIASLLYQAYKDPFKCWGTYIITQRYIGQLFSTYVGVAFFGVLFLSFFAKNPGMVRKLRYGAILLIGLPLIGLSILVGYDSSKTTGLYMGIILVTVVAILNYTDRVTRADTAKIAFAYCCGAVSIALYFVLSIVTNTNILKYGRLSFFGDIKSIAFTAFIPLIMILSSKLEGKKCFNNIDSILLDAALIAVYSALIILTAARGMIFAGIFALGIQALFSKNQIKIVWKLLPVALFMAVFLYMTMASGNYRTDRLLDFQSAEFDTLNGRTILWREYYELYKDGSIIRKLFGFGPGEGGRLVNSGLYTHSTYLDFLISYGAIGFITMTIYEVRAFRKVARARDVVLLALFVFAVVAELTHGSSADYALLSLHAFLVLCVYASRDKEDLPVSGKKR